MLISDSIILTPLRRIETQGGDVLHALKCHDCGFFGFGEAYFSWIEHGAVKAWKRHTRMTMNLIVPIGNVRFVFYLGADQFRVEEIGEARYQRITVPPGLWFGFQGCAQPRSLVLNLADIIHDPKESERLSQANINFDWS
jgi:dTDP-4-dehydrorhamnose 3,5-epimerase